MICHCFYQFGAVAGTNTQTGSSLNHRPCIFITKDGELGQIHVLCLLESTVQISPARPLKNAVLGKILAYFTQKGCVD